jgi:ABC-2 type transport system permease protein
MFGSIHNWPRMLLFSLRRDRVWLPLWLLGCVTMATFFMPAMPGMVASDSDVIVLQEMFKNPAIVAMMGLSYGDSFSYGSMYSQFMLCWTAMLVAAMNVLLVIRHTRKDEELGRFELVCSLPVGKNANLLATMAAALLSNLVIGLLVGPILYGLGTMDATLAEDVAFGGSMLFGVAIAASGLAFAGITLVLVQVTSSSRAALGMSMGLLGLSYLLRAAGDISSEPLSLISPLGIIERCYLYVDDAIWPVLVLLAEFVVLAALAFVLSTVRDSGAGLLPQRGGRTHASAAFSSPLGFAWRMSRGTCIAWCLIMFSLGASYGSVFGDMQGFYESNEMYAAMINSMGSEVVGDLINPVIAMLMLIMTAVTAAPTAMVVLKLKGEENHGRTEQVYSKSVSRVRLFIWFVVIAVVLAALLQLTVALGMYVGCVYSMDEPIGLGLLTEAALNYLPGAVFFAGAAALLVGLLPRATTATWLLLVYSFAMVYVGGILKLPDWVIRATPFGMLSRYPVEEVDPLLAIGLLAGTTLLAAVGIAAYRRRDLNG